MLMLPTEATHRRLSQRLEDLDAERLTADLNSRGTILTAREVDQRLIRNRLDKTIAEQVQRESQRPDVFTVRHALLNLPVPNSLVAPDRAVIGQGAPGDDASPARNRDARVLETPLAVEMAGAQFDH